MNRRESQTTQPQGADCGPGVEDRHCPHAPSREPHGGGYDGDTPSRLGERDQRLRVSSLQHDVGLHTPDAARAVEDLAGSEPRPEEQNRLVLERGDVHRRALARPMARRHGREHPYRRQETPSQALAPAQRSGNSGTSAQRKGARDYAV
jgi:hypothetical protein